MTDVDQLLAAGFEELGRQAPHDADLAGSVRRRGRRQLAVLASAVAVIVLAGAAAVAVGRTRAPAAPVAATPTTPALGCAPPETGPLPEWARTGFSSADPGIPFVRSRSGTMVAILFADPLRSPPDPDHANKILWVLGPLPRASVTPGLGTDSFWADARLEGSDLRVRKEIGLAPGPSYVDLPAAGCWQLELHWGAYSDMVSLRYAPR
jgi:hypothetical protein